MPNMACWFINTQKLTKSFLKNCVNKQPTTFADLRNSACDSMLSSTSFYLEAKKDNLLLHRHLFTAG